MPTYAQLAQPRHPDFDADYWRKIRALYDGQNGVRRAMRDGALRDALFPRHMGEDDAVYQERCKRAFIIPYMGETLNYMVSALGADPVRLSEDGPEGAGALSGKANGDEFYDGLVKNCAPPQARPMSLNQLLRQQALTALLYKRAWTLVDLPRLGPDEEPPLNLLDQEARGLDRAYACPIDPEVVTDWEEDDYGELLWALLRVVTSKRLALGSDRSMVREEYTYWTRDGWERYIYEYDPNKNPPKDEQAPDVTESGDHTFGRVPLRRMEVPEGLWAGSKIEGICTEHFNKRNALSWGMYRSLFQFLSITLQAPDALAPVTEDQTRAVRQTIGPGRVWVGAEKDKVEYISPQAEPFKVAMADLDNLRDEMHRVLHQMAQSVDNSGAALKRSAESKTVDASATAVILKEMGRLLRDHAEDVFTTISHGRGEDKDWTAQGADQFDEVAMDSLVTEAQVLESIAIPSPTFQALYKFELARRALPGATEEQLGEIMDELKDGITAEDELNKATRDLTTERIDQGVAPGETPPAPADEDAPPAKAKGKKSSKSKR